MPVNVRFDGDASNLQGAQQSVADGAKSIREEYKKLIQDAKPVERETKKIWEQSRPPLEKYNERVKQLDTLLKLGKITQDQYTQAVTKYRAELRLAELGQIAAFGDKAISSLESYAASFIGISTAIGFATKAFRDFRQEREDAAQGVQDIAKGLGFLAQLPLSEQQRREAVSATQEIFRTGATDDFFEAAKVGFGAVSAGLQDQIKLFGELGRLKIVPEGLEQLPDIVQRIRQGFGAQEAGTPEQILSKIFAASGATGQAAAPLASAIAKAASSGSRVGLSDEQTTAAVTVLSQTFGGESFSRATSLFSKAALVGIEADTVDSLISQVQQRQARGETIKDIFKSEDKELIEGLDNLTKNIQEVNRVAQIVTEGQDTELQNRIRQAEASPTVVTAALVQSASNTARLADELIGNEEALEKSLAELQDTADQLRGMNRLLRFSLTARTDIERALGFEGFNVARAQRGAADFVARERFEEERNEFGIQTLDAIRETSQHLRVIRQLMEGQNLPVPSIVTPEAN